MPHAESGEGSAREPAISGLDSSAATRGASPAEVWQCRYFVRNLPAAFAPERLADLATEVLGPLVEHDAYFLGADLDVNVKVRFRTRSIKLNRLVDSAEDGLELWRTETDERLPAPPDTWEEVASRLELGLDPRGIGRLADPGEVVAVLCGYAGKVRCVEVAKERSSFLVPAGRVELAEVVVGGAASHSIAFEAETLSSARLLRSQLWGPGLGAPENYVSFCSRSLDSRPSSPR